ncbi:hypothetical protein ANCDUO_18027, partial [Ancylostoma duodenale]
NVDPAQFSTFADFRKTLRLKCETDKVAAYFQFTPDEKTPDTLYYQVLCSFPSRSAPPKVVSKAGTIV